MRQQQQKIVNPLDITCTEQVNKWKKKNYLDKNEAIESKLR